MAVQRKDIVSAAANWKVTVPGSSSEVQPYGNLTDGPGKVLCVYVCVCGRAICRLWEGGGLMHHTEVNYQQISYIIYYLGYKCRTPQLLLILCVYACVHACECVHAYIMLEYCEYMCVLC